MARISSSPRSHGVIATLVIAAVFFRYVLNDPLTWTEETIVLLFTWMLFAGLASGFRNRMHIRIDALLLALPRSGRALFGAIAVAATLVHFSASSGSASSRASCSPAPRRR